MKIYKYKPDGEGIVRLPVGYTLLHVGIQDNAFTLWAAINPDAPLVTYTLNVLPTGGDIDKFYLQDFVGTVIDKLGLVWHLFLSRKL